MKLFLPFLYTFSLVLLFFFFLINSNFFFLWLMLELNLFFFVVLLKNSNGVVKSFKKFGLSPSMIYFSFQSLGSILIFSGLKLNFFNFFIIFGIFLKLGMLPFFWWLPYLSFFLGWLKFFFLLTINKFILFYILMFFFLKELVLKMLMVSIIFSFFGLLKNCSKFKLMLSWSSLIDTSLMIYCGFFSIKISFFYMFFYSLMLLFVSLFFFVFKNSFYFFLKKNKKFFSNFSISFMVLVLLGFPPFLGFFYKFFFLWNCCFLSFKFSLKIINIILFFFFPMMFFQSLVYFLYFLETSFFILNFWMSGKIFFSSVFFFILMFFPFFFLLIFVLF